MSRPHHQPVVQVRLLLPSQPLQVSVTALTFCSPRTQQGMPNRLLGSSILFTALALFGAYTLWAIVLVSLLSSHPLIRLFLLVLTVLLFALRLDSPSYRTTRPSTAGCRTASGRSCSRRWCWSGGWAPLASTSACCCGETRCSSWRGGSTATLSNDDLKTSTKAPQGRAHTTLIKHS